MVQQLRRRCVSIYVRRVLDVIALALSEAQHVDFPAQEVTSTLAAHVALRVLVRSIERHLACRCPLTIRIIEVVATPVVVGSISGHASLEHDAGRTRIVTYDKNDVTLFASACPR